MDLETIFDWVGVGCVLLGCAILLLCYHRYRRQKRSYSQLFLLGIAVFCITASWGFFFTSADFGAIWIDLPYFQAYLLYTPCLLFSLALCLSNLVLLRREGSAPHNLLAAALGILLAGSEILLIHCPWSVADCVLPFVLNICFMFLLSYFLSLLLGTILSAAFCLLQRVPTNKDFIIVLGCGLNGETVTPLLAARVEVAARFYRKQQRATGKAPRIIASGGQGRDEAVSEAQAMCDHLVRLGIPRSDILLEDKSHNTRENMAFSKAIVDALQPGARCAFATTKFHLYRATIYAHQAGLVADGIGSRTRWYFWPNAFVREFVGLLSMYKKQHALIVAALVAYSCIAGGLRFSEIYLPLQDRRQGIRLD